MARLYHKTLRACSLTFSATADSGRPAAYGSLTKEQFDAEIEKDMADIREDRVYSADEVEAEMRRDFGI